MRLLTADCSPDVFVLPLEKYFHVVRPDSPRQSDLVPPLLQVHLPLRVEPVQAAQSAAAQPEVRDLHVRQIASPVQVTEVELLYDLLESLFWSDHVPGVVEGGAEDYLLLCDLGGQYSDYLQRVEA